MELKATLNKHYSKDERLNFIVEQNHRLGYEIKETDNGLEAWGYTEEELQQQQLEQLNNTEILQQDLWNFLLPLQRKEVEEKLKEIPELNKKIMIEINNPTYKYGSTLVKAIEAIYQVDCSELI